MADLPLYHALCATLTIGLGALVLLGLLHVLRRGRPDLAIGAPVIAAYALRVAMFLFLTALGSRARGIRGPDDYGFYLAAVRLGGSSLAGHDWLYSLRHEFHLVVPALQLAILGPAGADALRPLQCAIEIAGLMLIAAAVRDIAGARAGAICMWIAALEPTNAFFSGFIHKESVYMLGQGMLVLGTVGLWRRSTWRSWALVAAGALLLTSTRSYAGAAAVAAVAAALVHSRLAPRYPARRLAVAMALGVFAVLGAGIALAPHVAPGQLTALQASLDFVPPDPGLSHLQLGHVNVTTSTGLAAALVNRGLALILRPFPWQLADLNQRLAAMGTLCWFALIGGSLLLLARPLARRDPRLAIIGYFVVFEAVAFSLSLTDAALGFRHRMHIVVLLGATIALLIGDRRLPTRARRIR